MVKIDKSNIHYVLSNSKVIGTQFRFSDDISPEEIEYAGAQHGMVLEVDENKKIASYTEAAIVPETINYMSSCIMATFKEPLEKVYSFEERIKILDTLKVFLASNVYIPVEAIEFLTSKERSFIERFLLYLEDIGIKKGDIMYVVGLSDVAILNICINFLAQEVIEKLSFLDTKRTNTLKV